MGNKRIWATLDPFIEGGDVVGRKVANMSFLCALLEADPFTEYHFFLSTSAALKRQRTWLEKRFPQLMRRKALRFFLQQELHIRLRRETYYVFHLSDCLGRMTALARFRAAFAPRLFPITAPTHSLSYQRFMPEFLAHLWPGVCPGDAIIATSQSAVAMLEATFSTLRERYGLSPARFPMPNLVHIPLGVDLAALPKPAERWNAQAEKQEALPSEQGPDNAMRLRRSLGLATETLFLCLARISRSSKMDALPLLTAFHQAAAMGLGQKQAVLVLAGWVDADDALPEALQRYAHTLGVRVIVLARPDMATRRALYAAADVFLSPVDNVQETFGLTLAEAGVSGLPVIASDFDGYRDIVVPEETGLLIPTLGFAGTGESNVLASLWYDNQYHLRLAQETVVDIPALASALARLGADAESRRRMGEAARARCLAHFSWETVLRRYLALWEELNDRPVSEEQEKTIRTAAHPLGMDFAVAFQGHFSQVLDEVTARERILRRSTMGTALYRGALPLLDYAGQDYMLDKDALRRVLLAARKPGPAHALLEAAAQGLDADLPPAVARERAAFTVLWALKQGYLEQA